MENYLSTPPKHMIGAIIGDIVGSVYEFHNIHTIDFELFSPGCDFTDDTVMTVAVAQAFVNTRRNENLSLHEELIDCMRLYGRRFPHRGYGNRFNQWLSTEDTRPNSSWGNGAPMRASAAGWLAASLEEAEQLGAATAETTHGHPDAVNAASTVAGLIYMGRTGEPHSRMYDYLCSMGYDISEVPKSVEFDVSAKGTMPVALSCFINGRSFEDVLRRSVAIGGDTDTIAAIACSIAESYYGIPDELRNRAWLYLPRLMRKTLRDFNDIIPT